MDSESQKKEPMAGTLQVPGGPAGGLAQKVDGPFEKGARLSLMDCAVVGTLSIPSENRDQQRFFGLLRKARVDSRFREQLYLLRDALLLSALHERQAGHGMVIGLTGPRGGEGVSIVSLLLCLSLGECAQTRVAFLSGQFDLQCFTALTELLGMSCNSAGIPTKLSDVVGYRNKNLPNVCFLRNVARGRSLDFFSDKRLESFIAELRREFDFTVVELPPLLKESAGAFVLPHLDRFYIVVEAGKTRVAEVQQCTAIAQQVASKVSGVILNKQKVPWWSRIFWKDFFFQCRV